MAVLVTRRHPRGRVAGAAHLRPQYCAACQTYDGCRPFLESLLLLHPPVLEPDFDLRLVELQRRSDLDAAGSGEVLIEVEFLFEFCELLVGEVGASRVVGCDGGGGRQPQGPR